MQQVPEATASPNPSAQHGAGIEAGGLVRSFGAFRALDGVSVSIQAGEFFSLLGPSGCGKTTLLRIIAGLDSADAGSLTIGGEEMTAIPASRRPVNTVFQSYALFPHLTVRDNVSFGLRMKGLSSGEIAPRVERALDLVEIGSMAARKPAQLSGGQKQRVALARAIVNEPRVLLLDEPLAALDLRLRRQLQTELRVLQRRLGMTFVHVTHDQEEALALSDRIAVMNAGRIEQVASGRELYERPKNRFVAQFLGSCNLIPGTVTARSGNVLTVATNVGPLEVRADHGTLPASSQVTLAIRPERVRLNPDLPGRNSFHAGLLDATFTGAETRFTLSASEMILRAAQTSGLATSDSLRPGRNVVVDLPSSALMLLED